ncbi:hypothetical protein [Deinococcus aquaticus]|uniref:hypothetical protein n=1 Tax=Deinococcus aquaticus TaxID=328692 RepID=UPI00361E280A
MRRIAEAHGGHLHYDRLHPDRLPEQTPGDVPGTAPTHHPAAPPTLMPPRTTARPT